MKFLASASRPHLRVRAYPYESGQVEHRIACNVHVTHLSFDGQVRTMEYGLPVEDRENTICGRTIFSLLEEQVVRPHVAVTERWRNT